MNIPTEIYTTLRTLVADKVYPDEAAEDAEPPFIVFRLVSQDVLQTLDGRVHATQDNWSIDVWGDSRPAVVALAGQVQQAMRNSAMSTQYQGQTWGADVDMGFEGCSLDFLIIDHAP